MKKILSELLIINLLVLISTLGNLYAQDNTFPVIIDKVANGAIKLDPVPPADGRCAAGTIITVTALPDAGYVLDSAYYSVKGRWGQMYHESM